MSESNLVQLFSDFTTTLREAIYDHSLSDHEIDYLRTTLRSTLGTLEGYRNNLSPVNQLPSEVLEHIFRFVVAPLPLDQHIMTSTPPQLSWARSLALVCSKWSNIVLYSPRIWYHAVDLSPLTPEGPLSVHPRFDGCLHGLSNIPLHLYTTLPPRQPLVSCAGHMRHRPPLKESSLVREVHLKVDIRYESALASQSPLPPQVELLSIVAVKPDGVFPYLHYMPTIYNGDTRNLKALIIDYFAPFLPGNAFPNLMHLRLARLAPPVLSLANVFLLLSRCPRLETFELILDHARAHDLQPADIQDPGDSIPLPSLRALTLDGLYVHVALAILAGLDLPPHITLRLANLALPSHTQTTFLPAAPLPFPQVVAALRNVADLTRMDVFDCIRAGQSTRDFHVIAEGERTGVWIHVTAPEADSTSNILEHIHTELPMQNLRILRMSLRPERFVCLPHMLRRAPVLDTLVVRSERPLSGPEAAAIMETLSSSLAIPGVVDVPVPAPQLASLAVEMDCEDAVMSLPILQMAMWRALNDAPIVSATFSIPGVDEQDWMRIQEHVVEGVHCQGRNLWEPPMHVSPIWLVENKYWGGTHPKQDNLRAWGLPQVEHSM